MPPEIGELLAGTNGTVGWITSLPHGLIHIQWSDGRWDWYHLGHLENFRYNLTYYYGLSAGR